MGTGTEELIGKKESNEYYCNQWSLQGNELSYNLDSPCRVRHRWMTLQPKWLPKKGVTMQITNAIFVIEVEEKGKRKSEAWSYSCQMELFCFYCSVAILLVSDPTPLLSSGQQVISFFKPLVQLQIGTKKQTNQWMEIYRIHNSIKPLFKRIINQQLHILRLLHGELGHRLLLRLSLHNKQTHW